MKVGTRPLWLGGAAVAPRVIAHRGSSAEAPENTLAAFRLARADGADGVELDVMRCASGEIIVFHDDDLERLCGVVGDPRRRTWSELRELSVRGEAIPQLAEVIETLGPELLLNVELKAAPGLRGRMDDGLAATVGEILRHHGMELRALVSSFDPLLLYRFRATTPDLATGLLFAADQSRPLRDAWAAPLVGVDAVHPEAALVDEHHVAIWRQHERAVIVWTVDHPAEIRYLASLRVDGIITNRPRETRAALEGRPVLASVREAS